MGISAKIIADSKSPNGARLTTFLLVFPRIVLAEFNTHRALSRNSASSRAIPFNKMIQMVKDDPFVPIKWMKDHKGMQGSEYFEDSIVCENLRMEWFKARNTALVQAQKLSGMGLTKQICNRLLEPFMWHTVIATASNWENFFALRAHEAAEIHIQDLAYKMLDAYNTSTPKELKHGEWHIPFGDRFDEERILLEVPVVDRSEVKEAKIKIATARCARVSYLNFEGKDDYEADVKLHDHLRQAGHWSPFEHCAMAASNTFDAASFGNFEGFIQYRKLFGDENKKDSRVIKK